MALRTFKEIYEQILKKDARYPANAYIFVRMALDYTVKKVFKNKSPQERERHVSACELLDGIRIFALETFGPMAATVFKEWGVSKTDDFGNIVYNLIDVGELRRSSDDKKEEFNGAYTFKEAFEEPFLPSKNKILK